MASQQTVVGLRRSLSDSLFPIFPIDLSDDAAVSKLPLDAEVIIFTVTPSRYDEAGYQQVYQHILGNVIDWASRHKVQPLVLLVSSTSVYGQQDGEWVDESSPTQPASASGRWILFGERQLQVKLSHTLIVRFSGIYSEKRTHLIQRALSGTAIQKMPAIWTNRIHESDCVGVLLFLLARYQQGQSLQAVYLASDDEPVSQYDVCAFICQQMGQPVPAVEVHSISKACNKRCCNKRLKALGYIFLYANYRQGYSRIFSDRSL